MKARFATALVIPLVLAAGSASAGLALGPRAGFTATDGLEQWHVGAHLRAGELLQNVEITPGCELGFGSHATIITANGDVTYKATELVTAPWGLHAGGSLSFNYFDWKGNSDVHLGLSGLVSVTRELGPASEVFTEVRVGILDSPDLKITFGLTFF